MGKLAWNPPPPAKLLLRLLRLLLLYHYNTRVQLHVALIGAGGRIE